MGDESWKERFIDALYGLLGDDDEPVNPLARATLARLRRGLGKDFDWDAAAFIARSGVPTSSRAEAAALLIAGLFALYPTRKGAHSVSTALRMLMETKVGSEAPERRLRSLLQADWEDLPTKLRQVVMLLRSDDIKIDWHILLDDLTRWTWPSRKVQRRWAREFWTPANRSADENALVASLAETQPQEN